MRRDRFRPLWWVMLVLAAMLPSLAQYARNPDGANFGFFHDDGLYFVGAKSLAAKGAFLLESVPGEPKSTKFPPLWPAYLSLAWLAEPRFPDNLKMAYLLAWLAVPVALGMAAGLLRKMGHGVWETAAVVLLMGLSPVVVLLGNSLMSEVFFSALLYAALWLAERAAVGRSAFLAGLVAGAAFLARSAGLPLLASAPFVYCLRKQFRLGIFFAAGMLPVAAAWMAWGAANRLDAGGDANLAFYAGYLDQMRANQDGGMLSVMLYQNVGSLFSAMGRLLIFNLADTFWSNYGSQLLGLVAVGGVFFLEKRRGITHYGAFVAGMALMLVAWCYPPTERFLVPAFPLLAAGMLYFLRETVAILRKALREKRGGERVIAAGGLAMVFALAVLYAVQTREALMEFVPQSVERYRAILPAKRAAYAWMKQHSSPGDMVSAWIDPAVYLYAERKSMGVHLPMKLFYGGDRKAAVEYVVGRPWPTAWPRPRFVLWTPDAYETELTPTEMSEVSARFERDPQLRREFADRGVVVYRVLN